jgi:hypothetical protein
MDVFDPSENFGILVLEPREPKLGRMHLNELEISPL